MSGSCSTVTWCVLEQRRPDQLDQAIGTGLVRSACVIGDGRSGLPWSAWLGLLPEFFDMSKNSSSDRVTGGTSRSDRVMMSSVTI